MQDLSKEYKESMSKLDRRITQLQQQRATYKSNTTQYYELSVRIADLENMHSDLCFALEQMHRGTRCAMCHMIDMI